MGTNRHRSAVVAVVAIVGALALGACGTDEPGAQTGGQTPTQIDVGATEYEFDPSEVTAVADQDVEATLTSDGQLEHEWVVLDAGREIAAEDEFAEGMVAFELEADPGQSSSGTLNLPSGDYQVVCMVPGHFAQGMEGRLTVE